MAKCSGVYLAVAAILATAAAQTDAGAPARNDPQHADARRHSDAGPRARAPYRLAPARPDRGCLPCPREQVSGPEWLSGQGFDIEAKVPEGTLRQQVNEMLQALLEERFVRKVHPESRSVP